MRYLYSCFLILISIFSVHAQGRIQYDADTAVIKMQNSETVRYLWKSKANRPVLFKQNETRVSNDSSVYYASRNVMESFGNIRIKDDSTTITSDLLIYNGDSRTAQLKKNVVYHKGERWMYTDFLDYNIDSEIASYSGGGKLVDTTNTLTSNYAVFFAKENYAVFTQKVKLVSPEFTLESDTLRYNTTTKIAYTDGPTVITNEDGTQLFSQGGEFRTYIDQSQFIEGNVETEDYYLEGEELFFDDLKKYYRGTGNVMLTSKENDVIITGDEGYYDRNARRSVIYGNPVMKRIMEADTFYLAADTLVAIESEYDSAKRILAYPDIRIFKSNLQGLADSSAYYRSDSIIMMYGDPILWTNKNQIRSDTIELQLKNKTIDQMILRRDAFLVNQDTMGHFNQIKGRNMVTYFRNNLIESMSVDGNGESIFYILDEGDSLLVGMNKMLCSDMKLIFENNDISTITVYTQPEGRIVPPHEISADDEVLSGFGWLYDKRPLLKDIFAKPEAIDRSRKSRPNKPSNTKKPDKNKPSMNKDLPEGKNVMRGRN
jgi:lipopolysaccharide export system protein LptA